MTRVLRLVLLPLSAVALAACGTSPPVRYYSLEPIAADYATDRDDAAIVGLGPLRMPDYLDRSHMVIRGDGNQVLVDDINRWAEPLGKAVHRILAANVDGLLASVIVVAFPHTTVAGLGYRIAGRIDRFDADRAGRAVLAVQWRVEDRDGHILVPPRRDRYEASVGAPGDADARAHAMNELLATYSRDIAEVLRRELAAGDSTP